MLDKPIEQLVTHVTILAVIQNIKKINDTWYVQFIGSTESIVIGRDAPAWSIGDAVQIRISRLPPT